MRTHAVHRPRNHERLKTWIATPLKRLAMTISASLAQGP
jgi:hypothetical protein